MQCKFQIGVTQEGYINCVYDKFIEKHQETSNNGFNILREHTGGGSINIKLNGCSQQQHIIEAFWARPPLTTSKAIITVSIAHLVIGCHI